MTEQRAEYTATAVPSDKSYYRLVMIAHDLRLTLEWIIAFKRQHGGDSPSYREIADGLGIASTNTVKTRLKRLAESGLVRLSGFRARRIEVVGGEWKMREQ